MLFNSYEFSLLFLPLTVAVSAILSRFGMGPRKVFLLSASIGFYAYAGLDFLAYLASSVFANFVFAGLIARWQGRSRKLMTGAAVCVNIAALAVAKYSGFFVENVNAMIGTDLQLMKLIVPLGISFFTFSQIAYAVGVSRAEIGHRLFLDYALYVFYFPKLLMGPIVEPKAFFESVENARGVDWQKMASGLQLFFFGLFKKAFFADAFTRAVAYGFSTTDSLSSLDVAVVALSYTFEIYFDFSGYTDMAIGVSRMFGIDLPINFDSPYRAVSVRDFWKRWHLTLTGFLTKYVYFPLGGSRVGTAKTYRNILIVFLVSGLWHGANWTFVLWGGLHGLFMVRDRMMERWDEKVPRLIRWGLMFALTNVLWLLFRSRDLTQFGTMMRDLLSFQMTVNPVLTHTVTDPLPLWAMLAIAFAFCLALPSNARRIFRPTWWNLALTVGAALWGLCSLGGSNTFVYFNF